MAQERITQKDIYNAISDLRHEIMVELKDVRADVDDLKDFKSRAYGFMALISIAAGGFFSWMWKRITGE
jgi:hypothetical protein